MRGTELAETALKVCIRMKIKMKINLQHYDLNPLILFLLSHFSDHISLIPYLYSFFFPCIT